MHEDEDDPFPAPVGLQEAPAAPEQPQVGLGDYVLYVLPVGPCQGEDRLAVVSRAAGEGDRGPDLHVFGRPGDHPNVSTTHYVRVAMQVVYSAERKPGTWHSLREAQTGLSPCGATERSEGA